MTREEIVDKLEKIAGFFRARADMAIGDGKMLLLSWYKAAEEARGLIEAQEPRVMTLAEALDADYVYLDIKLHTSHPCYCCILAVDEDHGIIPLHRGFCGCLDGEEYGETWRCWTSKPTNKERQETKWV